MALTAFLLPKRPVHFWHLQNKSWRWRHWFSVSKALSTTSSNAVLKKEKEKEKVSLAEISLHTAHWRRLPQSDNKASCTPYKAGRDALILTNTNRMLKVLLIVYGLNSQHFLKKQSRDLRPYSKALYALFLMASL